jgi:DNA polymerase-3 subunit alpha
MMVQFAEYCFNKSHSQAYAMLTYQTAYLKTHYPVEYMTALLSSVSGDKDKVQGYIAECQAMNIDILPPDVNVSGLDFTADKSAIRFGLSAVRNIGEAAVLNIVAERETAGSFKSLPDFVNRIDLRSVNKRALEALIKCGACLSLGISRKQALENLDSLVERASRQQIERASGQISLFSMAADQGLSLSSELKGESAEFPETELQSMEHEFLGFYITSHPLRRVVNRLRWLTTHAIRDLKEIGDGTNVIIGGLATQVEKKLTKQNKLLSIIRLEDLAGQIDVVAYSELLDRLPTDVLVPQSLLLIKGKTKKNEDEVSVLASSIRKISDASLVSIYFEEEQSFTELHRLKEILSSYRGDDPVLLNFPKGKQNQTILVGCQFWVDASRDLRGAIVGGFRNGVKVSVSRVQV